MTNLPIPPPATPPEKPWEPGWRTVVAFIVSGYVLYLLFTNPQFVGANTFTFIASVIIGVIALPVACYSGMLTMVIIGDWLI